MAQRAAANEGLQLVPSASTAPTSSGFVGVAYRSTNPKPYEAYRSGRSLGYFHSAEMAALVYARTRAEIHTPSSYRPQPVQPFATEEQIQRSDAQLQAQAASPRQISLARMGQCAPACRYLGIDHPASHNQVVDAIRRAQLYSTQETVGARVSGANIGEAFDIWIKCDSDAVFPAGMFVGSRLHGDNVDLRAGQTGSIPGEIKYAKGAETLCQGVYLSTRVRQSWTAPPQQDESEDVRSLGQLRSMVPSEIDLMLSGAVYQILIVVPAVELQSDVRWPVYITASAAQRTNLARQFAPPGPHPVPRLVKGKHGGSHWALALSRTFENTASLYTPIAYLV